MRILKLNMIKKKQREITVISPINLAQNRIYFSELNLSELLATVRPRPIKKRPPDKWGKHTKIVNCK